MKVEEGLAANNGGLARLGRPREFGKKQQNPVRRFGGIAIVLVLHIVLIYALLNGLATKVVQVIQHPIETRIIEPVKPPPPPPMPVVKLPPPKFAPPPPPFVPPPEVPVQAPPQATITHQSAPVQSAPAVAPPVAAAPAAKPVSHEVGVVCPNSDSIRASMQYPKEAQENNITGDVMIEFVVDAEGNITNERVAQSADPVLDRAAYNTVKRFKCVAQGQSVRVQVPFSFNLN
ncbi:energy transducer TonB [Burkholderia sp. FERM BP-3421]|jgi:periplasmic protein TonB|uniref:energy transducer TonB n=1 Tax=Burkholderia sp. FERM BP-3421 TaxID=1494466 RepID=UPI00235DDD29|nr:energy transducer TonB [Burkholderia sp. FERM BP-3421]WDD91099.1 energy transducer TonB [Burkholderia sp. FERM BP-3421]